VIVEAVEALGPRSSGVLGPGGGLREGLGLEATGPALRIAPALDQAGVLEHLQVTRDRGQADRERRGELEHGGLAGGEAHHDRAPGCIGEGGERRVELGGGRLHLCLTFMLNTAGRQAVRPARDRWLLRPRSRAAPAATGGGRTSRT